MYVCGDGKWGVDYFSYPNTQSVFTSSFFLPIRLLSMMPHYDGKDLTKCLSKVGSYQHLLIYFTVMENHKWSNRWLPFKLLILIAVCFFSSNLAT